MFIVYMDVRYGNVCLRLNFPNIIFKLFADQ